MCLRIKKIPALIFLFFLFGSVEAQEKIGIFDSHLDVGDCKNKGFVNYNKEAQTYIIGGSGKNMWFGEDQFHYLWTSIQGDFILRTEVDFLGEGVDPHRKVGWIVKNDLNSETPHVNATVHGDGLTSLQYRRSIGGDTEEMVSEDSLPDVIQLERKGNEFIMSTARFGKQFVKVSATNEAIGNYVYVGIYVCSHNPEIVESARFRNVRIIKPAEENFVPYRDYIGSHLEVMEVASGHRKILHSNKNSIQAPNWTVDGKHLIFNSEGRLFRYHLKDKKIDPINTGFAIRNNNDHVLTFDGKRIGISHHNAKDDNQSAIYHLPIDGSAKPAMVTKKGVGASYLHGWSPDGEKMIFTADRKGQYDIYSIDVASGKEVQLTDEKTLDDGSEFSPDGEYIYFNSARTGKMKLWRMDSDGKNQTQLTFDEYNDWFPHVSPDQKWIVFISFPKDINPQDHPFYQHCLIRIMPYEGGKPKIVGYIYGGQGTINVPSWSPDSKYISFVSNSKL